MSDDDQHGQVVMKRYGTGTEHGELCEIIAVINQPTYELKGVDGHVFTWVQSITRPATPDEAVKYWRERAKKAEEIARQALDSATTDGEGKL